MSVKVMSRVWDDKRITSQGDLVILLALADFCNDEGYCWPSIPTIARKTRASIRGVYYTLKKLQSQGLVRLVSGGGRHKTNQYFIPLQGLHRLEINPANGDKNGANGCNKPCKAFAPDPSGTVKEPSGVHRKHKKYPSEAFKSVGLIDTEIEKIKNNDANRKTPDGRLDQKSLARIKELKELRQKNLEIAIGV